MTHPTMPECCADCGMACAPGEYHPYAACLMFRACHDGDEVRANLKAVRDHAGELVRESCAAVAEQAHPQDWPFIGAAIRSMGSTK